MHYTGITNKNTMAHIIALLECSQVRPGKEKKSHTKCKSSVFAATLEVNKASFSHIAPTFNTGINLRIMSLYPIDKKNRHCNDEYATDVLGCLPTEKSMLLWGYLSSVTLLVEWQRVAWRVNSDHNILSIIAGHQLRISGYSMWLTEDIWSVIF